MISFRSNSAVFATLVVSLWFLNFANAVTDDQTNILILEDFADPQHAWTQMNDPVMGGKSTGTFTLNSISSLGEFVGNVAIVPFLKAPGFIKVETKRGETWPDASACKGLQITARASTDYSGYRVSFGKNKPDGGMPYTYGYKTDMNLAVLDDFVDLKFPFDAFTDNWDAATGDAIISCEQDSQYCPDAASKKDVSTIAIWGEGVEGDVHLELKTIAAYGCTSDFTSSSSSNSMMKDPPVPVPVPLSSTLKSDSEIMIEDFANPTNDWTTLNDPVMGGQSESSLSISDGVAHFEGYCAIVPFLKAPGFITMVTGRYDQGPAVFPDVSTCSSLKVVLRSDVRYNGYYLSFGAAKGRGHAMGYKTRLHFVPMGEYGNMILDFSSFSSSWDDATGKTTVACADDRQYCPTISSLQDMKTISFWGEGVEGDVKLYIKSISAVGCDSSVDENYSMGYGPVTNGQEWGGSEHGDASGEASWHKNDDGASHSHEYGGKGGEEYEHHGEYSHGDHGYDHEAEPEAATTTSIGSPGFSMGTYIFIALAAFGGSLLGGVALGKIKRGFGICSQYLYGPVAIGNEGLHSPHLKGGVGEQC